MKQTPLPKYIKPRRLCDEGAVLSGEYPMSHFERLKDVLADDQGKVTISLKFGFDQQRLPYIKGEIEVSWHLLCQRCAKAIESTASMAFLLSPTYTEDAAKRLPTVYDALMLEDDKVLLATIIEDELLLDMPMIPKHETEDCMEVLQKFNEKGDNA